MTTTPGPAADEEFTLDVDVDLRCERRVETDMIGRCQPMAELGRSTGADGQ